MLEELLQADQKLLLFLNELHSPFFDVLICWLTHVWFWLPVLALLLWFMWKHYKKKMILIVAFSALSIVFSDQISGIIKNKTARLRPTHNTEINPKLHLHTHTKYCSLTKYGETYTGGEYGFVSSHAANSFALTLLLIYFFKPINRRVRWLFILFPLIFSYTRIYLGVHYVSDIIGGALVGICCGLFTIGLYYVVVKRIIFFNM